MQRTITPRLHIRFQLSELVTSASDKLVTSAVACFRRPGSGRDGGVAAMLYGSGRTANSNETAGVHEMRVNEQCVCGAPIMLCVAYCGRSLPCRSQL
jgi:hypothetical protein